MAEPTRLLVGAMSGTSADGVDVALVRAAGRGEGRSAQFLRHHHRPYDPLLRRKIFSLREAGATTLADLAWVGRGVSLAHAAAVNELLLAAGVSARDVAAVAAHGQTLYHAPPDTVQWLDPALLAAETGCAVVSDFRRADCAAGGQGAPLVPFADYVLFRSPRLTRVLLNIGGVANLTHLPAGAGPDRVTAFDTGPGNCVSDHLARTLDPAGPGWDAGGARAARGRPVADVVDRVRADPYFTRPPPKSTDGPAMIDLFTRAAAGVRGPPEDLLRSACQVTADTILDAIRRFLRPFPDELVVSGGGAKNATLMALLRRGLGGVPVLATDDLGVPGDAKEAVAFALLAAATLDGEPSNVPSATGAARAVVLGAVTPRA